MQNINLLEYFLLYLTKYPLEYFLLQRKQGGGDPGHLLSTILLANSSALFSTSKLIFLYKCPLFNCDGKRSDNDLLRENCAES